VSRRHFVAAHMTAHGPKGDIRSAAELQASNRQLLALTAYSITSSARTSIRGRRGETEGFGGLGTRCEPNDPPVQLLD
jgi:hypothetical protein